MSYAATLAFVLAVGLYLIIGVQTGRGTRSIDDYLPILPGRKARVDDTRQFSSSTVATTISLATVVMAYFELAPQFGVWLFWTVITTVLGLLAVWAVAPRIWKKMETYDHRPTLHEFLGEEFSSPALSVIAASATSLGFLGAFAVELTVGGRFLAGLVPEIPIWITVAVLSAVAFIYTSAGGFRAVILTDRLQMGAIWVLLAMLSVYYVYYVGTHGGWSQRFAEVPASVVNLTWRGGLTSFLIGVSILNVPIYISDMSVWQRIAGSQESQTVYRGLLSSTVETGISWSILIILACMAFMVAESGSSTNLLLSVLNTIEGGSAVGYGLLFIIAFGLYACMLSTASTQLIAASHTLYEDILSRAGRNLPLAERLNSESEVRLSRLFLLAVALLATAVVALLIAAGFSIADLVFAVYGAQLGLVVPVLLSLFADRETLSRLSKWATLAVGLGFAAGWAAAVVGKIIGSPNLIFLAPAASLGVSCTLVLVGFVYR
jgi:Na+/proline symporter